MNSATESWPFVARPLTPNLGAEISGVNLADGLPDAVFRALQVFVSYEMADAGFAQGGERVFYAAQAAECPFLK